MILDCRKCEIQLFYGNFRAWKACEGKNLLIRYSKQLDNRRITIIYTENYFCDSWTVCICRTGGFVYIFNAPYVFVPLPTRNNWENVEPSTWKFYFFRGLIAPTSRAFVSTKIPSKLPFFIPNLLPLTKLDNIISLRRRRMQFIVTVTVLSRRK